MLSHWYQLKLYGLINLWFTHEPVSLAHVIMGRVVAYKLDCTMIHDKDIEKPAENIIAHQPLDDGSSSLSEPIDWFWEGPGDPEYGYLPNSDDSGADSIF